ncbi:Sodium/pantothenate symporter [Polystyrenella longa]|uniref:Sodium/pantothenate symporter n=1 Tax=Polystyrenella longa TaxID=2528007 RepID=A0A518CRT3_9PLAN|nr:hypothetical protein [Polystyrenella longa]QDU81925.1 Sodium/pantothenate symporter [Polystyrenella longa]
MNSMLIVFLIYTLAVFGLAIFSNKLLKSKGFMSEYFLGSRSLGVWAFALTFAATSASGGSFTGFPSLIYTYGWVLGLWIASYMVVPICTMGWLGKRLNQVARISGAITIPDVMRDRFHSRGLGLFTVLIILFFMIFNLVAQFKAGSVILKTLLADVDLFRNAGLSLEAWTSTIPFLATSMGGEYLLCLLVFGLAVIFYTTYGGFHAVVWTDVMQGIVMVFGVMIMLPLAIYQVGGLGNATRDMAQMVPPRTGDLQFSLTEPTDQNLSLNSKHWLVEAIENAEEGQPAHNIYRLKARIDISAGESTGETLLEGKPSTVQVLKIMTPHEIERIYENHQEDPDFFTITSATFNPTDFQTTNEAGEVEDFYPVTEDGKPLRGTYVSAPGADPSSNKGFLPIAVAVSFFVYWAFSGAGQPSNMVRLMAFNSSMTLKKSITTVAIYFTMIYFPLVIIFCCARVLMPGMEAESDRIMPAMTVLLTQNANVPWLAGVLVAAPFAAVMSTIDSFLLMMSSAIVRDIYQRNINPEASDKTIKRVSFTSTFIIGLIAMFFAIDPPQFLQDIIVYTGGGLATCFLAPVVYAIFWPKCNKQTIFASMAIGLGVHFLCHILGLMFNGEFLSPYKVFGFDPIITSMVASFVGGLIVGKLFPAPDEALIRKYFGKNEG